MCHFFVKDILFGILFNATYVQCEIAATMQSTTDALADAGRAILC